MVETKQMGSRCASPLVASDFVQYDKQPDGNLYRNEFINDELGCFARRLCETGDSDVRGTFNGAVGGSLWEDIRKTLLVIDPTTLTAEGAKRREDLLKLEYSDRFWHGSGSVNLNVSNENKYTRSGGNSSTDNNRDITLSASTALDLLLQRGGYRLDGTLNLTGSQVWNRQHHEGGDQTLYQETDYRTLKWSASTTLRRRYDDMFKISASGSGAHQFNPAPDSALNSWNVGGGVESRNIRDVLSLSAYINWSQSNYTAPFVAEYWQRSGDSLSVSGEVGFLRKKWGGFILYNFTRSENGSSDTKTEGDSHTVTLLAQRTLERGSIRFGAGAGVWENDIRYRFASLADQAVAGSQIHAKASVKRDIGRDVTLNIEGIINANFAEGDLNGWYPSWVAGANLVYDNSSLNVILSAAYNGNRADIDKFQETHDVEAGLKEIAYKTDRFRLSLTVTGKLSEQYGYNAQRSSSLTAQVNVQGMPLKSPRIWTGAYGGAAIGQFSAGDSIFRTGAGWWLGLWGSLYY